MKRNTLMKRLAVAALAATMTVGMAVPTFAYTSSAVTDEHKGISSFAGAKHINLYHEDDDVAVEDWYSLDSFEDDADINLFNAIKVDDSGNAYDDSDTSAHKLYVEETDEGLPSFALTEDGTLYVVIGQKNGDPVYKKVDNFKHDVTVEEQGNGQVTVTVGEKDDTDFYVVWTVTPQNTNYFDTSVEDNTLSLQANEFGTTVFDYTGTLYHNGKVADDDKKEEASGRFAVTMPLNEYSIKEVVEDSLTVTPAAASDSTKAAVAGKDAIVAGLTARAPKELNFTQETREGWEVFTYHTADNKDHELEVTVDNVSDFHANESFEAHVVVRDTTLDPDKEYDLGRMTFTIKDEDDKFEDVSSDKYFYDAVQWGIDEGIINGYEDGTFKPYNNLTREQVALMIYREADSPVVDTAEIEKKFSDVGSLSDESKKAIAYGFREGIIKGTSDTTFSPKASITRAQLVTMLYRDSDDYDEYHSDYNEDGFNDVVHGSFYEDAVNWAVSNGVTTGTSKTTFGPNDTTTRAQGVTFLYRYYNL